MTKYLYITLLLLTLTIPACGGNKNTLGGAALGGIAGGIVGTQIGGGTGQIAAIIGGTLVGAALGGYVGSYMDRMDRQNLNQTLEYTPTNNTTSWKNPDTNSQYQVTPKRPYKQPETQNYCREYQMVAIIGGKEEVIYGEACRQPDGQWEVGDL